MDSFERKTQSMDRIEHILKINDVSYIRLPILRNRKTDKYIIPDFTVINKQTGENFVWLHFSDMGNKDYKDTVFFPKFKEYSEMGFILGLNLLVTVEKEDRRLSDEEIEDTVRRYLLS